MWRRTEILVPVLPEVFYTEIDHARTHGVHSQKDHRIKIVRQEGKQQLANPIFRLAIVQLCLPQARYETSVGVKPRVLVLVAKFHQRVNCRIVLIDVFSFVCSRISLVVKFHVNFFFNNPNFFFEKHSLFEYAERCLHCEFDPDAAILILGLLIGVILPRCSLDI